MPEAGADDPQASRPWPVLVLTALGAWLAAIPLMGVVGLLLGDLVTHGAGTYAIGLLLIAGAVVVLRSQALPIFVEQLAVPALLAGGGTLAFALGRDLSMQAAAAILCGVALVLAVAIPLAWLRTLLGALAAGLALAMLAPERWFGRGGALWLPLHLVALAGLAGQTLQRRLPPRSADLLRAITTGWLAVTLVALAWWSGMTFLVGGVASPGMGDELAGAMFGRGPAALAMRVASTALALVAAWQLARAWPTVRQPLAAPLAVVVAGLCWFLPALGMTLLVLALAATGARWRLAGLAALAAAWIAGSFYYQLAWPLATKALVLAGAGAALGGLAWIAQRRPVAKAAGAPFERRPALLIAGCAVATLLLVNQAIWQKERLIAQGQPVFVALAPVDPRSLMQGDFMRLAYRLPDVLPAASAGAARPRVVARRDARGVAQILRVDDGQPLAPGDLRIELTPTHGGWTLVSDAWFFAEGEATRWQAARFAELRVADDGRALLVGLADAQLRPIRSTP